MLFSHFKCKQNIFLKNLGSVGFLSLLLPLSLHANDNVDYLFSLSLEELLKVEVSVASNVVRSVRKQPVSVFSINKDQINLSGARTLNELLTLFVPGYFLVEDQDDTIAGFRGLVPDNNSKTLLLLNGTPLNSEWFWGAADNILNGLDLDFIERIDIVRGPGSVTLGQGALLGAIDIITKKEARKNINISLSTGQNDYQKVNLSASYHNESTSAYAYFSTGTYDGQIMRNEGWANSRLEQGLTVFERQHHLKRSEHTNFFANMVHQQFEMDL